LVGKPITPRAATRSVLFALRIGTSEFENGLAGLHIVKFEGAKLESI
jgi:hypothetical protein